MSVVLSHVGLSAETYRWFRAEAGWDVPSPERAQIALDNSLDLSLILDSKRPVAMARVIGDGAMNLYIHDVITAREHRRRGHASRMVGALIGRMQTRYDSEITIGLLAAAAQAPLYARFGFQARPSDIFGPGMNAPLGALSPSPRAV